MFGLGLGRLGASGSGAFSPSSVAGKRLWLRPSVTAGMWQDSAGTTALSTVGTVLDSSNPVGLMLDYSQGATLGPELLTNTGGPFTSLTGASTFQASIALSSGEIIITATDVAAPQAYFTFDNGVVGKTYKVTATVRAGVGGVVRVFGADGGGYYPLLLTSTSSSLVTVSAVMVAAGTNISFGIGTGTTVGDTAAVYAISVREILGNHLTQSTSTARPVLSARKNLLVGTDTLSTQSVTVTAAPHTFQKAGAGTVTASGAYSGVLTDGQTFTPTAGTLTLTVAGSVTSAQLELGAVKTAYQSVVSASSYTAVVPQYLKLDGADDALASATFTAGTLGSNVDVFIVVRRDAAGNVTLGYPTPGATTYFGMAESGSGSVCHASVGTPTVWVNGVQLSGGTSVTRGTLHTALTVGDWHVVEFRNLDLSAWTQFGQGGHTGYLLNGAMGERLIADAMPDATRAKVRTYLGKTVGKVL